MLSGSTGHFSCHLSCHLGLAAGCGNSPLQRTGLWLRSRGRWWAPGGANTEDPCGGKLKQFNYLCNFSLFPQNCLLRNGQRRRRLGPHGPHSMSYNRRFVTVPLCGSSPHFPSISLCQPTLLSACPLLGTLLDIDGTQIALGSWLWEGYCLVWGTNNFDIRV